MWRYRGVGELDDVACGVLLLLLAASCGHGGELPVQPRPAPAHDAANVPAPPPAAVDPRRVLETFSAPPYAYELFIARRAPDAQQQDEDPYGVRLLQTGRTLDEVLLSDSSCGQASVHPVDGVRGADSESKFWTTEAEHCATGIAARIVTLSAQRTALLLTQSKGYERRYSSHYLYVADAGRLHARWNYDESFGSEERTSVSVISGATPDRQDVAFIHVLRMNDVAVEASAQRLRLDDSSAEIDANPLPDAESPLYLVVAGSYTKPREALRLRSECLAEFDLLKASFFPARGLPPLYFGRIFARRADAEKLLARLAACPELPKPRVVEVAQRGGHGTHQ